MVWAPSQPYPEAARPTAEPTAACAAAGTAWQAIAGNGQILLSQTNPEAARWPTAGGEEVDREEAVPQIVGRTRRQWTGMQ